MEHPALVPVNGTIYVVDDKKEERTKGGILLPDNAEGNRMIKGTVLATSPFLLEDGSWMDPPAQTGHRVMYSMMAGAGNTWIDEANRCLYRLLKWNEILAIVNEKS